MQNLPRDGREDTRARLYGEYVASGQARVSATGATSSAATVFRLRAPFIRRIVRRYLPTNRSARILDLGCGHGAFVFFCTEAGFSNVIGVDVSAEQVALASTLGIANVLWADFREYLSRPGPQFDAVLLIDVIEHFRVDEVLVLLEAVRARLAPEGRLVMHVPNAEGIFGARIRYGDLTHELAFTPSSAEQLLFSAGFSDVKCHEDRPPVHGVLSLGRLVVWLLLSAPFRLLMASETGAISAVLSQNMTVTARLPAT